MVMGPTHAMSGAAAWLGAAAAGWLPAVATTNEATVLAGAAVCAGSALLPDLDCPGSLSTKDGSTVVRAFGFIGEAVGHSLSAISLAVYNLTASKYDKPRNSGHRTLTHTLVFAVVLGAGLSWLASLSTPVALPDGKEHPAGHIAVAVIMFASLHLALFGLAEKWTKKQRAKYGLLVVCGVSLVLTAVTIANLGSSSSPWLGIAVGCGAAVHCLGDAITKQGVPFVWPVPIHGKRWWEITLPSLLRIRAGGTFEYVVLMPILTVVTVLLVVWTMPGGSEFTTMVTSRI